MTTATETYKGYKIRIEYYDDPINPYEDYDHFGTLCHWHRRGFIGENYAHNIEALQERVREVMDSGGVAVPVWLYEHSGQTIRAGDSNPFHCPWDSGQVGVWIATADEIAAEFNGDKERAIKLIKSEVKTLDSYLRGECYGYVIERDGEEIDSCWGFLGDDDYCLQEARSVVDHLERKNLPLLDFAGLLA